MQDPACGSYSNAILFYKGYQAIQVHRIANCLWNSGQQISARALQSRVSEVSYPPFPPSWSQVCIIKERCDSVFCYSYTVLKEYH